MRKIEVLHANPSPRQFSSSNNRKLTLGRRSPLKRVQSVPMYKEEVIYGKPKRTFLGYRYIYH